MNLFRHLTQYISAGVIGFTSLMAFNNDAHAQLSYPYTADFESASCVPANSSYASTDPIVMNGVAWVMPGMYLGAPETPPGDKFLDGRAGRLRLTNNSSGDPGSIYTDEDFTGGVGTFSFYAADYGSEDGSTLTVQYSTDGGATWIDVATLSSEEITGELQEFSFDINQPGNVRLKLLKDGSNKRINLDNFTVTHYEDPTIISLLSKSPVGTGIPLSTSTLTLTYSSDIIAGAGTITVTKVDDATATQTFTVPSGDVTITGATATIDGLELDNFTSYYVTMTAGCFKKAIDPTVENTAIVSSTDWVFTTVDMTPPPTMTSLNETFNDCVSGDLTAVFNQYSVVGSKVWNCTTFGHSDEYAVRINGGSAEGVSEANQDWLITNNPYNISSLSAPQLKYWMKRRFNGEVNLSIKVSTDYIGSGDPTLATWTELANVSSIADSNAWVEGTAISLASVASSNFYIAFVYTCGETGAIELSIDDIQITSTTSTEDITKAEQSLTVIGDATTDRIEVALNALNAGELTFQVLDINGRVINDFKVNVHAGMNNVVLAPLNIQSGLYIIRAIDSYGRYIQPVKAIVK